MLKFICTVYLIIYSDSSEFWSKSEWVFEFWSGTKVGNLSDSDLDSNSVPELIFGRSTISIFVSQISEEFFLDLDGFHNFTLYRSGILVSQQKLSKEPIKPFIGRKHHILQEISFVVSLETLRKWRWIRFYVIFR